MFKVCGYRNHEWLTEQFSGRMEGEFNDYRSNNIRHFNFFPYKKATLSDLENYKDYRC